VQRAINKFISLGWLAKIKRSYQSCCYWLVDCLHKVNLDTKSFFKKQPIHSENDQQDDHVLGSYKEKEEYTSTEVQVQSHKAPEEEPLLIQIAEPFKQMKRLTDQQRDKLGSTFSEYELRQMLEDASWYKKQGKEIRNLFAFFWNRGKNIAQKMGRYI
jgi:hypothetical protein